MPGSAVLMANLRQIPAWAATFHVPDVVGYRDIVDAPAVFLDEAGQRCLDRSTDPPDFFPYPKGQGRYRKFTLISPLDLVIARAVAGEIVERTDSLLPTTVYSSRLHAPPPGWRFESPRCAHRSFRKAARSLAKKHGGMLKMDVSEYFPSLDIPQLNQILLSSGCPQPAVNHLLALLRSWQQQGCTGIPIGGEAFSVLGNAYVLPLDMRLLAQGIPYLRWMDDVFVFGNAPLRSSAIVVADDELNRLRLARSEAKTNEYDLLAALQVIEDGMLTSVFDGARCLGRSASRRLLRDRFLEHVVAAEDIVTRRFRALVKGLQYRRDSFAVYWFATRPDLLNEDPIVVGDYLLALPPPSPIADMFVDTLTRTPRELRDGLDARDLHLLRGLSGRSWGRDEGAVFWDIAMDDSRRGPVRAWAMMAAVRSPAWRLDDVIERVLEEESPYVRRAFLLSLERHVDDRRVRSLLAHIRGWVDDLVPMAAWITRPSRP